MVDPAPLSYLLKTNLEAALVPTHLHTVPTAKALIQAFIVPQHCFPTHVLLHPFLISLQLQ